MRSLPLARVESLLATLSSAESDEGRLRAYQDKRLQRLVCHAYANVPYYRSLFDKHHVAPGDIGGVRDLHRIPITSRTTLQDQTPADRVARGCNPEQLISHRTSGSTGAPLTIRRTWFEERLLNGVRLKEWFRLGLRPTDHRAMVALRPGPASPPLYSRLGILRRSSVSCLLPAEAILDRLADLQPDILSGFPGTMLWMAGAATDEHLRRIRPRHIGVGAETSTPESRRLIAERFGAPVYDFYAAHEFNLIARLCPESGYYHVVEPSVIVEVLKDGAPVRPGECGELVGTALHSFASPFIRYRLGDLVTRGPDRCPCGAPVTTLERIRGRVVDRFPMPDGTTIHGYEFAAPVARASWIRRFQIVQTRLDRVTIRIVVMPGQEPAEDERGRLRAEINRRTGGRLDLTLELVPDLPLPENGKFRLYCPLPTPGRVS